MGVKADRETLASGSPIDAARALLGARIRVDVAPGPVEFRLVEVEAYGTPADGRHPDPASHGFRGPTPRTTVMFGLPGHLYVYRSYGIHLCANVTCGPEGECGAVLLRGAEIVSGFDVVAGRRPNAPRDHAARGPGNLGAAMALDLLHNGIDLLSRQSPIRLMQLAELPDSMVATGPRVGVSLGARRPWRLWVSGSPAVSAYRRGGQRRSAGTHGRALVVRKRTDTTGSLS